LNVGNDYTFDSFFFFFPQQPSKCVLYFYLCMA
jgi:hypothetical protein